LSDGERQALEDLAQLRQVPLLGITLLADVEFPWEVKPIIRWHHERRDGSGFPDGLAGDEIPLGAQIVGILDAYDELITTAQHGRAPLSADAAFERISADRQLWAPAVFEAFRKVVAPTRPAI
jgi:HD-GYP domain-containing protein (c-di-GMP phosphodiesterase class II)